MEEGVIKFKAAFEYAPPPSLDKVHDLIDCRHRLFRRKLIGALPNGIGYGNISKRLGPPDQFVISGSGTGQVEWLKPRHLCQVMDFNPAENTLSCQGPVMASSESMTHGMVYRSLPACGAVIHVHHQELWQLLVDQLPATPADVPYGSPQMARAVANLLKDPVILREKVFAMAGHEEGVVSFGKDMDEAESALMKWFSQL